MREPKGIPECLVGTRGVPQALGCVRRTQIRRKTPYPSQYSTIAETNPNSNET